MPNYLYVTILCIVIVFMIIREIYMFNKGEYYPYLNGNQEDSFKKRMFDIGLLIVILVSGYIHDLSPHNKLSIFIFPLLLIALCLCVTTLNYLTYVKIKDRRIISQTIILDISTIVFLLIMKLIIS